MLRSNQEPTRDQWVRSRQPGRLSAVFHAGEEMRCPQSRVVASGRRLICGYGIGQAPDWVREVVVRAILDLPPIPGEHMVKHCPSCHKTLDVFLIRAIRLEATG